jgi:sulfite exporter TauE/SafE
VHHHHALPPSGDLLLLFVASVLGSAHCVGMCGPYVAICAARMAPQGASAPVRFLVRLLFNAGRVATYVIIGWVAGSIGQIALAATLPFGLSGAVAIVAGLFTGLFALVLLGVLTDPTRLLARAGVDVLIRGGLLRAFKAPGVLAPVLLGSLQGAFPCAMVYAAASRAAIAGNAARGAMTMLVFGLGTVPAIFALTTLPAALLQRLHTRRWAAIPLLAVGILLLLRGLAAFGLVAHSWLW